MKLQISEEFRAKVKLNEKPAYRIAQEAGLDPSTLSKLMCGIANIQPGDRRVLSVARVIGIPFDACFQEPQTEK
jgi:transcriptional regulator with XRE-family HTH domain